MAAKRRGRDRKGKFIAKRNSYHVNRKRNTEKIEEKENSREEKTEDVKWNDGRRVVELEVLANGLENCQKCKEKPLLLSNCVGENRFGLGSILKVQCQNCLFINNVPTGKRHSSNNTENQKIWDANTKCALAMIHNGLGPVQVVNFLSALNIPPITTKALKKREREVGVVVEDKARQSCQQAIQEELTLTRNNTNANQSDEIMMEDTTENIQVSCSGDGPIVSENLQSYSASYDGGWQKRGSGKCYNSLSGHGALVGAASGKVLNWKVLTSDCRKCLFTDDPTTHDCRKKNCGSAKSMESAIAVEIVSELKSLGYKLNTLTMDDDTTTISRLHSSVDPLILKNSDSNHVKKNLSNELYNLKSNYRTLNSSIINYFVKCLAYTLAQNKDNSTSLKLNLKAVVPHAFGCHDACNSEWCGFLKSLDTYCHKDLPGGNSLTDQNLRQDLTTIFDKFVNISEKLSGCGSTQINESLNHMIASKAPKTKHFGGSESLDYRVAATVAQKNIGSHYVIEVNQERGLSPGKATARNTLKLDKKRALVKKLKSLPSTKRKRVQKKQSKQQRQSAKEIREGVTYRTSVDNDSDRDDVDSIPECIDPPICSPITLEREKKVEMVVFDLETTGFGYGAEIVQISAKSSDSDFNGYILPKKPMDKKASEVTNLYSTGCALYYKGEKLQTVEKRKCLSAFIDFLPANAVLIAHNCKNFDAKVLINELKSVNLLQNFEAKVAGFSDTLPLLKDKFPGRKSYTQTALVTDQIGETYNAHNATDDVRALRTLIGRLCIEDSEILKYSFTTEYLRNYLEYFNSWQTRVSSFQPLIRKKVLSKVMCEKAAKSGLNITHIKLAFKRGHFDGIKALFSEKNNQGSTRVTASKKVIDRVVNYLNE